MAISCTVTFCAAFFIICLLAQDHIAGTVMIQSKSVQHKGRPADARNGAVSRYLWKISLRCLRTCAITSTR